MLFRVCAIFVVFFFGYGVFRGSMFHLFKMRDGMRLAASRLVCTNPLSLFPSTCSGLYASWWWGPAPAPTWCPTRRCSPTRWATSSSPRPFKKATANGTGAHPPAFAGTGHAPWVAVGPTAHPGNGLAVAGLGLASLLQPRGEGVWMWEAS